MTIKTIQYQHKDRQIDERNRLESKNSPTHIWTKEYIPYDSIPFVENFKTDKTSVFPGSWRGSLTAEVDEKHFGMMEMFCILIGMVVE